MNGYFFLKGVKDWDALEKLQSEGKIRAFARLVSGEYSALVAVETPSAHAFSVTRDAVCPVGLLGCIPILGPVNPNHPMAIFPSEIVVFHEFELAPGKSQAFVEHALSHDGVAAIPVHGGGTHALVEISANDLNAAGEVLAHVAAHVSVRSVRSSVSGAALMTGAGPRT